MDWLERHLAVFPDPELVFVIGAGQGRDLSALARFSQTRLVLLEPQPRWADFLRQQTVSLPNTEVLQYALDDSSGISTLTVFNFAELSSLRPDPALTSLLPGARQTAQLQVETRSLGDLVESLEIPGGANNWLIVDALGVESAVIDGLADSDLRSRFGHIVMRTHQQAPNSVDPNLSTTAYTLLTFGYRPLGDMDYSDGDWPRMHLQHFDRSPQHKELETKVVALEQRSNEIETEKIDLQEQIAKLGEEIQAAQRDSEQSRQLLQHQDDHAAKAAELAEQLSRSTQTLEETQVKLKQRDAEAKEREKERDVALKAHEARVSELTGEIELLRSERNERIAKLEGVIDQTKSDLSISLRLQTLRESDLRELQERYADVLETRNAQHQLLLKIRKRLSLAAEYLLQLKNESDEQRKSELTSGLVEALAHDIVEGD